MDPLPSRTRLRREDGGIDLPSTMVSILVIAAFLAAAALAVFVVIPWAQDNAAKQKATQIVSAQSAYYALSTDGSAAGTGTDPQYASVHELVGEDLLAGVEAATETPYVAPPYKNEISHDSTRKVRISTLNVSSEGEVSSDGEILRDNFAIWVRSDTGKVFRARSDAPQPVPGIWGDSWTDA